MIRKVIPIFTNIQSRYLSIVNNESIIITKSCVNKINDLRNNSRNPKLKLRISVNSGGCSGYQYEFNMDDVINSDDKIISKDESKVVVIDEISLGFLKGSTIDYEREMIRTSFTVTKNPQSETACGCGSSFAIKSFEMNLI